MPVTRCLKLPCLAASGWIFEALPLHSCCNILHRAISDAIEALVGGFLIQPAQRLDELP